jgi:hypothetical protein
VFLRRDRCLEGTVLNPVKMRRDGRVAEGARLESVFTRKGNVGSNPTLSASFPLGDDILSGNPCLLYHCFQVPAAQQPLAQEEIEARNVGLKFGQAHFGGDVDAWQGEAINLRGTDLRGTDLRAGDLRA